MPEYGFYSYSGGCGLGSRPCTNCESEPQTAVSVFCSDECRDEYEGEGEYAE